jgi:hypothetical protein
MNEHNLEALSALIDGEVSPDERVQLESHLATCLDCREVYQAMLGLGAVVAPPIAADFSRRTAEFVRGRSSLPPGMPGGWKNFWNHPVRRLASPAKRRTSGIGPREALKILGLFGIPTLLMSLLRDSAQLQTFLGVASLGLLIGIPLRHFSSEVSLLGSLRRGRCLEEILGTGMRPSTLVDVLATQGLGELLKACALVLPALLLGALALPAGIRSEALLDGAFWIPAVAMLFLAGAYATQFFLSWAGAAPVLIGGSLVLASPILATQFALTSLYAHEGSNGVDPLSVILGLGLTALWVGLVGRRLALYGLNHPETVERWSRGRKSGRRLPHFSSNPIARRELARVSNSVSEGIGGLFLWRASMAIAPLAWGMWASSGNGAQWGPRFWTGVAVFAVAIFARSALRTLPAVVREREHRSWELLLQTRLGLTSFVSGWLQVALYTVFFESIFGVFVLLMFGLFAPTLLVEDHGLAHGFELATLAGVTLMGSCLVGANVGLALSASSENTRQASEGLLKLMVFSSIGALLGWVAYMCVFLPWLGELNNGFALDLTWHELPLTALLTLGLALWVWSWRTLRRDLYRLETPAKLERTVGRYPASLVPLELSALGYLAYAAMGVSALSGALNTFTSSTSESSLKMSFGLLGLLIGWVLVVRLPLATLAELAQGRKASLALGALYGLVAGAAVPLLSQTFQYLLAIKMLSSHAQESPLVWMANSHSSVPMWLGLGALVGLAFGALSARAVPVSEERWRKLRRRGAISMAFSVVSLAMLGTIVEHTFSIELDNPTDTHRSLEAARQRAEHDNAIPAARNGFNELKTMLYYHPEGNNNPFPAHDPYTGWKELGNLYSEDQSGGDHPLLKTEKARLAREHFLAVLPTLDKALNAPEYALPNTLDFSQQAPNYIQIRQIALDLAGLGWMDEKRGDLEGAVGAYERGFRWAGLSSGRGLLINEMISVAMHAIVWHRLMALESTTELSRSEQLRIIAMVEHSKIKPENLAQVLECELATDWNFTLQNSTPDAASQPWGYHQDLQSRLSLALPKFYLRYERIAMANTYLPMLRIARSLNQTLMLRPAINLYPMAFLTQALVPNLRGGSQFLLCLTRQEALRTVAALKLYRMDHGRWPADLSSLVGPYLHSPVNFALGPVRYEVVSGQPQLSLPHQAWYGSRGDRQVLFPLKESDY